LQWCFALLKQSPGHIDPRHFDEIRGRDTGLALRNVAHAHSGPTCQCIQGQIMRKMIEDPMLQGSNLSLVSDLRRPMRAELRLAAGTLQKDH